MKRQRMWMEVGVWPPPVRAQWRTVPSKAPRSRALAALVAGVVLGSAVTAVVGMVLS